MEALARAKTHNLDVAAIARETVRLILEEAFAVSRPSTDHRAACESTRADPVRLYPLYHPSSQTSRRLRRV
jgi:uracil-DNA glycosylase